MTDMIYRLKEIVYLSIYLFIILEEEEMVEGVTLYMYYSQHYIPHSVCHCVQKKDVGRRIHSHRVQSIIRKIHYITTTLHFTQFFVFLSMAQRKHRG